MAKSTEVPQWLSVKSVTIYCPTLEREVTSSEYYFYSNDNHGCDGEYCYCDTGSYLEFTCECKTKPARKIVHTITL